MKLGGFRDFVQQDENAVNDFLGKTLWTAPIGGALNLAWNTIKLPKELAMSVVKAIKTQGAKAAAQQFGTDAVKQVLKVLASPARGYAHTWSGDLTNALD